MTLLEAIEAAAEAQAKLDKLTSADANLSVKGAVAEAKRQGGKDEEADKILAEIEAGSPDGMLLRLYESENETAERGFAEWCCFTVKEWLKLSDHEL